MIFHLCTSLPGENTACTMTCNAMLSSEAERMWYSRQLDNNQLHVL